MEKMLDGYPEVAELFSRMREAEGEQIAALMDGLESRLGDVDRSGLARAAE